MFALESRNLIKEELPEHDELYECLSFLSPLTGLGDKLFCNGFLFESVELLKHGLSLYEDGYFDCAFYSVRQGIELLNNMLYLSESEEELAKWRAKERFPADHRVKEALKRFNSEYSEMKEAVPEIFDTYDTLLSQANKIIHKQGFDTFYQQMTASADQSYSKTVLFQGFLKQSIRLLLILVIVLDPLSLALSDPKIDSHIDFEPMTEPIPPAFLNKLFSTEEIKKIKGTQMFRSIADFFLGKEQLNEATYDTIRYQYFDIDKLTDIVSQKNHLNLYAGLCLSILLAGLRISHFYYENDFIGFSTSIKPSHSVSCISSNQFDVYLEGNGKPNIPWNQMFITVKRAFDTYIILQHNSELSIAELESLQSIIDAYNHDYELAGLQLLDYFKEYTIPKGQGE